MLNLDTVAAMNGFFIPLQTDSQESFKQEKVVLFFDVLIKKFPDALKNSLIYNSS